MLLVILTILVGIFALSDNKFRPKERSLLKKLTFSGWIASVLIIILAVLVWAENNKKDETIHEIREYSRQTERNQQETLRGIHVALEGINAADLSRDRINREMRDLLVDLMYTVVDLHTKSPFKEWQNFRVGNMFFTLSKLDDACAFYDYQLRFTPTHSPTLFNRAITSIKMGKNNDAVGFLKRIPGNNLSKKFRDIVRRWIEELNTSSGKTIRMREEDWRIWWFPFSGTSK